MRTEPVSRRPTRFSAALSLAAVAVAPAVAVGRSPTGLAVALAGCALLLAGVGFGSRRAVTLGAAGAFAGVLLAGIAGAAAEVVLAGACATTFAWVVGGYGVDLGAQLGREAPTARVEVVHATGVGVVLSATAGLGYGVFRAIAGGQPMAALVLLLLAAAVLVAALDYS